jgi:hypothetical protein
MPRSEALVLNKDEAALRASVQHAPRVRVMSALPNTMVRTLDSQKFPIASVLG